MVKEILADARHTTREDIMRAILQRTTRGMLTFNTGKVHHLEGALWAVPSTRGGFVTITTEEDAEERDEAVPCRRCAAGEEV